MKKSIENAIVALAKKTQRAWRKSCLDVAGVHKTNTNRFFICDGVILFDTYLKINFDQSLFCSGIEYDDIYEQFDFTKAEKINIDDIKNSIQKVKDDIKQNKDFNKIITLDNKALFYYDVLKSVIKCFDDSVFAELLPIKNNSGYYVLRLCDIYSQAIVMPLRAEYYKGR